MNPTMEKLFKLPDLGEGLTESEILSWKVAVGDSVELNQVIAEVETAKAVVELPSPYRGIVTKVFEPVGSVVNVGHPIISFEVPAPTGSGGLPPAGSVGPEGSAKRQPTLVGYGAAVESSDRPTRRGRAATVQSLETRSPDQEEPRQRTGNASVHQPPEASATTGLGHLLARPPVRKLARDLQVDLAALRPSGSGGLITREDVLKAGGPAAGTPSGTAAEPSMEPSSSREHRMHVHGVRKATATAMVSSAFTAPHVSVFLGVDVTESMALLERLRRAPHLEGAKLTITTLVSKIVCALLARHRALNAHWDSETEEIVEFEYVNLGIAAATDRGLMVPVAHEAQGMDLRTLAVKISEITEAARAGKVSPAQLSGGTFSISNIGVFGVDAGTPILPPGQTGILALGQVRKLPWEFQEEVVLRQVMTLSLSFDHRVVDGAQGAKFLADLGQVLGDPGSFVGFV